MTHVGRNQLPGVSSGPAIDGGQRCRVQPAGAGYVPKRGLPGPPVQLIVPPPGQDLTSPQAVEHSRSFRQLVKWRTGSEGRISYLKRGYGWDRTWLDGRHGAATWCGHGVFARNLIRIGALAS